MQAMRQQEAALGGAAVRVRSAQGEVTRLSARLTGEMADLQARWAGRGGSAFQVLMVAWADQQRRITGALDALALALETTERDTVATDQGQADVANLLAGRLGGR